MTAAIRRHLEFHRQAKDTWTRHAARLELTTVDLIVGAGPGFEAAVRAAQSKQQGETLWYRMLAGGPVPRYVRLRPRPTLAALLETNGEGMLPDGTNGFVTKSTIEILSLRPAMSYGLPSGF
jgi:hypothetical protein